MFKRKNSLKYLDKDDVPLDPQALYAISNEGSMDYVFLNEILSKASEKWFVCSLLSKKQIILTPQTSKDLIPVENIPRLSEKFPHLEEKLKDFKSKERPSLAEKFENIKKAHEIEQEKKF